MKAQKRRELIDGSNARLCEALSLLRSNPSGEDWHIFEGNTQPDVFIQTPDLMIVVEGKRTEREATKNTKWMLGRHQMWRHIDCAWEIKGKREVFGFFIVQGEGLNDQVPAHWMEEVEITMGEEALASSLPHRGPEEQEGIRKSFIGVTTGRKCARSLGLTGVHSQTWLTDNYNDKSLCLVIFLPILGSEMVRVYKSFGELSEREKEGQDYRIEIRFRDKRVLVMAPHGGQIEPETTEIAEAIARDNFSVYSFEGIMLQAYFRQTGWTASRFMWMGSYKMLIERVVLNLTQQRQRSSSL